MESLKPKDAAKLIGISYPTIKQWIYDGKIKSSKTPGGHHRIPQAEIERLTGAKQMTAGKNGSGTSNAAHVEHNSILNHFEGTVKDIRTEGMFSEITVDVGGQQIISIIPSRGCEELGLKKGVRVYAMFKATEVVVSRP